ncbi:MAG: discoidin domain-containing protein [Planctomycetota bacterium]
MAPPRSVLKGVTLLVAALLCGGLSWGGLLGGASGLQAQAGPDAKLDRPVFVVSNFHPASCGWLTDWSTERNYCGNSYLAHLDRVRDDPSYAFALSEVNNLMAILEFAPGRVAELKQRIREGRVELVNAFFLEPTINLSGGEALVKMGVEGLRWQQAVFGVTPRSAWAIDVTGVHEQMGQIVSGLGLDAMVYTRDNPTSQTMHWLEAPAGSRTLAISPGGYADWGGFFQARAPLDDQAVRDFLKDAISRAALTPDMAPVLVLGGGGDYSLPPAVSDYPRRFLGDWRRIAPGAELRFTTLSAYLDTVLPLLRSGKIDIPINRSGAKHSWSSFWIQGPRVKGWYRRCEQALQSAEALATLASLRAGAQYPVAPLYHAWLLMLLNMDRNTLWSAAGGMVFEHDRSWDVKDRFEKVEAITTETAEAALRALLGTGEAAGLFNPLNWQRHDVLAVRLPVGTSLDGCVCEQDSEGRSLCDVGLPSLGVGSLRLTASAPVKPAIVALPRVIETDHYFARLDPDCGALASLKVKPSGREVLAGPVLLVAEQAGDYHETPERAGRKRLSDSRQSKATITVAEGPLAITVRSESRFYGSGVARQTVRFYKHHPRIDFDTELNDIPNLTVVTVEFPVSEPIQETRRGIPYGFSHGAWSKPNTSLSGWTQGIKPAIRWSHYQSEAGGVALLDRGLPGRELAGNTPLLFLMNAQEIYMGYPCAWLSGRGKHHFSYALVAHDGDWKGARIPHLAWEFNAPAIVLQGVAEKPAFSALTTSDNVIVEALRREGNEIELRLAECLGAGGTARVDIALPHEAPAMTDLVGGRRTPLRGPGPYELPIGPQQIVTLRLKTSSAIPAIEPLLKWDPLVPPAKLPALKQHLPGAVGHPPRGDWQPAPTLPSDAARALTIGKKATASNVFRGMAEYGPAMACDGRGDTRWATDSGVTQAWLEVDLGASRRLARAYLSEAYDRVLEFELQLERDGEWIAFARGDKIGTDLELRFDPVAAQRVRVNVLEATDGPTIWEFGLFDEIDATLENLPEK